jgi:RNA polymerase-binding transcription factor DksA
MMDQVVIRRRQDWLVQEINRVQADLQSIRAQCTQVLDNKGDVVDQANHTVDLATNLALRRVCERRLLQLERANAWLRAGGDGTCELCGVQIEPGRLDAIPYTTLCVGCQRESERRRKARCECEPI